jgi:hypothetical protein
VWVSRHKWLPRLFLAMLVLLPEYGDLGAFTATNLTVPRSVHIDGLGVIRHSAW